jgi:hypothetical protein
MMKALSVALGLALALGTTAVLADDDDDDKVPAAEVEKIEAVLSELGCSGYESLKKEEEGIYEIDDAKCKMGGTSKCSSSRAIRTAQGSSPEQRTDPGQFAAGSPPF